MFKKFLSGIVQACINHIIIVCEALFGGGWIDRLAFMVMTTVTFMILCVSGGIFAFACGQVGFTSLQAITLDAIILSAKAFYVICFPTFTLAIAFGISVKVMEFSVWAADAAKGWVGMQGVRFADWPKAWFYRDKTVPGWTAMEVHDACENAAAQTDKGHDYW